MPDTLRPITPGDRGDSLACRVLDGEADMG